MQHFMFKEIIFRGSMGYQESDFKEIVEEWIAGKCIQISSVALT
jgi:hypothetical protein